MNEPMIFDSWLAYGPRPGKDPDERWSLDHLRQDLDFYGIAGGIVRHEQCSYYDAMQVNRRLIQEIAPYRDRLVPCWMVLPHQAGDFPSPKELISAMDGEGVPAAWFRPARHSYPIHRDLLGPLAEAFNPRKIPILTTLADLNVNYNDAVEFCRIFENCPVVIAESNWSQWRIMTAIMDACPNARMEFHLFQSNRAVEYFSHRYGINRLLFGSGLLVHSGGAARAFVDWSMMDEINVRSFAGENLIRLLGFQSPAVPSPTNECDSLMLSARAGQAIPVRVLDAHCHVLDEGLDGAGFGYVMIDGDIRHILEVNRRCGIDASAIMSWTGTVGMDVEAGNSIMEKVVQAAPDRIIGLASFDPSHQSKQRMLDECRRLYDEVGFRGFKPYYMNDISYADDRYQPIWKYCNDHRLYGLLHTNPRAGGIAAAATLAERYPETTFLIAHSGGSWSYAHEVADVAKRFSNVMAEITYTPVLNGMIEWLCRNIGPDRVLFGTDTPMRDPRPQLGWCVHTRLPLEDKKKVLGGNFSRILQRATGMKFPLPEVFVVPEE